MDTIYIQEIVVVYRSSFRSVSSICCRWKSKMTLTTIMLWFFGVHTACSAGTPGSQLPPHKGWRRGGTTHPHRHSTRNLQQNHTPPDHWMSWSQHVVLGQFHSCNNQSHIDSVPTSLGELTTSVLEEGEAALATAATDNRGGMLLIAAYIQINR